MKNLLKFLSVFLTAISFLSFKTKVFAQSAADCVQTELGCIPKDPAGFVGKFYGIGLSLIGGVGLLFIIYGGYIILTSQGQPEMLNKGKSYIFYAIAGILLAVFGFVFVQLVLIDLLHIPGFS